jgi:quinol monooxygenase YgiN
MAGFVQIIEFESDKIDEIRRLQAELRETGELRMSMGVLTQDRDKPNSYVVVVEFPSWEAAEASNADPRTQEFAAKVEQLASTKPMFHNLDVVDRIR